MRRKLQLLVSCSLVFFFCGCGDRIEPIGPFFKLVEQGHIKDIKVAHHVTGFLLDSSRLGIYDRNEKRSHFLTTDSTSTNRFTNIASTWRNQRLVTGLTNEGLLVDDGIGLRPQFSADSGVIRCGGGFHRALVRDNKITLLKHWDTLYFDYVFEGDETIEALCVGTRNIWISTKGRGLARVPHVIFGTKVNWLRDDDYRVFADDILKMQPYDTEKVWFLGKQTLYHFSEKDWSLYHLPSGITPIDMAIKNDNKPLILTSDGLYHLDGINIKKYALLDPYIASDMELTCLDINHNGHIWLGTTDGLYVYQPEYE